MDQETNVAEPKEVVQEKTNSEVAAPEDMQEVNWKKFREARDMERKQLEEERKRAKLKEEEAAALKAAMDAILNKPAPVNSHQSFDYEEEETEDQRINKKVEAALLAKERQLEEERRRKEQAELPQRLAATYSDFNQVCSTENLDYLEYHYPEIATPFKHMPDGFDKWSSVYKAVKRFVANTDSKKDQKKADKNFNKPQSMTVSGVTQTGDTAPIQLDDKRRADNWKRMQRVMKGGK